MKHTARQAILGAMVLAMLGMAACGEDAKRDGEGAIVDDGDVSAFELRVGDCFNEGGQPTDTNEVTPVADVSAVPCADPHDIEVFALVEVGDGPQAPFPGDAAIAEEASGLCEAQFESYVGTPYETSELQFSPVLVPTAASWLEGDREAVCGLYEGDLSQASGSLKASGR